MLNVQPTHLESESVKLSPLSFEHAEGLEVACADGELWRLRVTSAPAPGQAMKYIEAGLSAQAQGQRVPFVVIDKQTNTIIGSTSYHDILPDVYRLEIGYTWYAKRYQRSHVNTQCKLLLMTHAFEALGCKTVGWRTDCFNFASQAAIERLGAKKDGIIRGNAMRRDGTIRDTVMYSVTHGEWPAIKDHLTYLLQLPR